MILDRDAVNNVAIFNFELAQRDADRIKVQAEEIAELTQVIVLNNKMVKKEKIHLYNVLKEKSDLV